MGAVKGRLIGSTGSSWGTGLYCPFLLHFEFRLYRRDLGACHHLPQCFVFFSAVDDDNWWAHFHWTPAENRQIRSYLADKKIWRHLLGKKRSLMHQTLTKSANLKDLRCVQYALERLLCDCHGTFVHKFDQWSQVVVGDIIEKKHWVRM